jgi:hypothetical protein
MIPPVGAAGARPLAHDHIAAEFLLTTGYHMVIWCFFKSAVQGSCPTRLKPANLLLFAFPDLSLSPFSDHAHGNDYSASDKNEGMDTGFPTVIKARTKAMTTWKVKFQTPQRCQKSSSLVLLLGVPDPNLGTLFRALI